jgi:uracil-DNA glycosylase
VRSILLEPQTADAAQYGIRYCRSAFTFMPTRIPALLTEVRTCTLCSGALAHGTRPVFQFHSSARILIAGQAPGSKVHESGIPFDDRSGDTLRRWLGLSAEQFYDPRLVAILPMAFCYPGKGKSGDLPPRPECAERWRAPLLQGLKAVELTLAIGQYAIAWHLPDERDGLTQAVQRWRHYWPHVIPLPHPSPRNIAWFKRNPWFEQELVPMLKARVEEVLRG